MTNAHIVKGASGGTGSFTAGGDLSGTDTSQTVEKIQNVTVDTANTTDGYVMTYESGTTSIKLKPPPGGGFTAGGDLTGTSSSQTVAKIQTVTINSVPASGNLVGTSDSQTLTGKTINASNNTITDTSAASGDLLRHDGTSFVRFARGAANTVCMANSGGNGTLFSLVANANVSASAAIAGTKISPDFGSQNVTTTGVITLSSTAATAGTIRLGNNQVIAARNVGNTVDVTLAGLDTGDQAIYGYGASNAWLRNNAIYLGDASPVINIGSSLNATSGTIRMRNADSIKARNAANSANITIADVNSSNSLYIGLNSSLGEQASAVYVYGNAGTYMGVGTTDYITLASSAVTINQTLTIGSSGPTITKGTGAPASSVADGSIYLRTDGSSSTGIYTRQGGSWSAVGGGPGGSPGGSDTQIQFNDSSSFGGDAGLTYNKTTNVLSVSDAIGIGATVAAAGSLRLPNAGSAVAVRNSGNTDDLVAVATNVANLYIGNDNAGTKQFTNTSVFASNQVQIGLGSTVKVTIGGGSSDHVTLGANAATSGLIRLATDSAVIFRNSDNSANVVGIKQNGTGIYVGADESQASQAATINLYASAQVYLGTGSTTRLQVTSSGVGLYQNTDSLDLGRTEVATTGKLRLRNTDAIVSRNGANDGNTIFAVTDVNNDMYIGTSAAYDTQMRGFRMYSTSGGIMGVANANYIGWGSFASASDQIAIFNGRNLALTTSNPSSTGDLRMGSAQSIKSRNNANSGDFTIVATDSSDNVNVGSGATTVKAATQFAVTRLSNNSGTSTLNDVSTSGGNFVKFTNATGPTITGFANGTDGKVLICYFTAASTITHEGAGSTAANRVTTQSGASLSAPAGSTLMFIYDGDSSRWRPVGAEV